MAYNQNGNLTPDLNKEIPANGITYNHLNLPTSVNIGGGNISYIYDASGTKLQKTVTEEGSVTSITDYAGGYIYEDRGLGPKLQFFNHAEGYVDAEGSDYNYVYQYKDHLGNVRLSYQDADNNGSITTSEIVEESNYYPFGLQHKGYGPETSSLGNSVAQKFKYNGVELEQSLGLNLYEMDVRSYDPAIARFTSIDPVTHNSMSTYTAFDNNPIFWADPSGADSWIYVNGGTYRNNQTGEETNDWQRAISDTQSHFGESPQDIIKVDSKNKRVDIIKTNDDFDTVSIDGQESFRAAKGVTENVFEEQGFSIWRPEGVGMGAVDNAILYLSGELLLKYAGAGILALWSNTGSKLIINAKWAQKTFSSTFSKTGTFAGRTVDDVAAALRSGRMKPGEVPIDIVVRDGQALILNTRSSAALSRAGIPRSKWNVTNRTGQEFYENQLTNQLTRNKLPSSGASTIRESGTREVISN